MQAVAPVQTSHKLRLNSSSAPQKASIGLKINQSVQLLVKTCKRADDFYFTTVTESNTLIGPWRTLEYMCISDFHWF